MMIRKFTYFFSVIPQFHTFFTYNLQFFIYDKEYSELQNIKQYYFNTRSTQIRSKQK